MQKTFKNQHGREFLLLDLPSGVEDVIILDLWFFGFGDVVNFRQPNNVLRSIELPKGNYQILCLAKDATEEQAVMVVDKIGSGIHFIGYDNYVDIVYSKTAKDSLTSLLTSLGFKQDDNVLILEKI